MNTLHKIATIFIIQAQKKKFSIRPNSIVEIVSDSLYKKLSIAICFIEFGYLTILGSLNKNCNLKKKGYIYKNNNY